MSFVAIALLGLLVIAAGVFLREFAIVARAHAPAQTRVVFVGDSAPACTADIPKVIWTYWQAEPAPAFIQACIANWRRSAPDHEVRLLNHNQLMQWLPALRADFDALSAARQSDWLRLQLLARHGGVWMDASTLLSRDLDWLHELHARRQAQYVGFYLERDTRQPERPAIETWFMASVPGGSFVTALTTAFDRMRDEDAEARLPSVAAELLDREAQRHRLALLRAEDGPSAWLAALGWRRHRHYARIALTHAPTRLPALLRLDEADRAITERNWLKGRWLSGSALIELLGPPR